MQQSNRSFRYCKHQTLTILFYYNQLVHIYIYIYHNIFSLYNVNSYMFWYICIILRESQNLCCTRQAITQATVTSQNTEYTVCSHINALFSQDVIMSHRLYCIIQWCFYLIILWNYNISNFKFNNLCSLVKFRFWNSLWMIQAYRNL